MSNSITKCHHPDRPFVESEAVMTMLGRGVYSLTEAARLTQLRPGRVRAWFQSLESGRPGQPVFQSDYPPVGGDRAISFLDLIEVCIAGKLRAAEPPVSLQHIRKVHQKLSLDTGQKHPFCVRDIYHSGGKIFTRSMDDQSSNSVIEPLTNQRYIDLIIMPFLRKIEYDEVSTLAKLWHIAEGVVIDPARCFGKPIVERVGIATRVLASYYEANGRDVQRVADWYGIDAEHIELAVAFEHRIAA
jgi:uncharacterized protein (DUF433 family)